MPSPTNPSIALEASALLHNLHLQRCAVEATPRYSCQDSDIGSGNATGEQGEQDELGERDALASTLKGQGSSLPHWVQLSGVAPQKILSLYPGKDDAADGSGGFDVVISWISASRSSRLPLRVFASAVFCRVDVRIRCCSLIVVIMFCLFSPHLSLLKWRCKYLFSTRARR